MKKRKSGTIGLAVILSVVMTMAGGSALAGANAPMTPKMAAKREMVRTQQGHRITYDKRKAAAEALKAERLKVHAARQNVQPSGPVTTGNK